MSGSNSPAIGLEVSFPYTFVALALTSITGMKSSLVFFVLSRVFAVSVAPVCVFSVSLDRLPRVTSVG